MEIMKLSLAERTLTFDDMKFNITNSVRSLADGRRKHDDVVRTVPSGKPYDPLAFPKGIWSVTAVEWQKDKGFSSAVYGPCKIRTNAFQYVKVWELDGDGDYFRETEEVAKDAGYLLHYSTSSTTLGCIRLDSERDAVLIGNIVESMLKNGEAVKIEVI